MPFDKGTFNIVFLKASGAIPAHHLELFQGKAAGKLDDVTDKPQIGWVSGRHLLERKIDEMTSETAGFTHLSLRISQRKIPSALLKAECRKEELDYMLAKNVGFVPATVRRNIRREIEERRLMTMPPSIAGIPLVLNPKDGSIFLSTSSPARIVLFQEMLEQTLKIGSVQLDFANIADLMLGEKLDKHRPVAFSSRQKSDGEDLSARDFLTWLWHHSETEEGEVKIRNSSFNCLVEGPFTFASSEECEGGVEISIRKGMPARSAEAKAALAVGKKLKKARLTISRGKDQWKAGFDADAFIFTSLELPEGEKLDPASAFEERMRLIAEFQTVMAEYVRTFFSLLKSGNWKTVQKDIIKWAEEREAC